LSLQDALLSLALLGCPIRAAAQRLGRDSSVSRLDWVSVNVLVHADSFGGVHVWALTSLIHHVGLEQSFLAYFDPARVLPWVDRASHLIHDQSSPPAEAEALQTPPLTAWDSSIVVLRRRRQGSHWEQDVRLYFLHPATGASWYVSLNLERAQEFLQALFVQALAAQQFPPVASAPGPSPADTLSYPQELAGNPDPVYPGGLDRVGLVGEVWLSFVVLPDGSVDRDSFLVYLADHPAFAQAAAEALVLARFRPGRYAGRPIAVRTFERIYFQQGRLPAN